MTRKVSKKAQKMANAYVDTKLDEHGNSTITEGSEFEIYANGRFYTFSFKNDRGYWSAKFEHYGRR